MKQKLGGVNCLYPMPTTLIGANVKSKPNYITIAHVGIMTLNTISLGMHKSHYTNEGIKENKTFSVNIPPENMVKEVDYCGIVSGRKIDKSTIFESFYGQLKTAPMIVECPLNMECRLVKIVDFPTHDVFVGEIVETYCNENILTDSVVDFSKVTPILFDMPRKSYWKLGDAFAPCWKIGQELKK